MLVEASKGSLRLASTVAVDVWAHILELRRIASDEGAVEDIDYEAIIGSGELLPAWYDDWLIGEREHIRQLRLLALDSLARRFHQNAKYADALAVSLAVIQDDPLRESAYRSLILIHLAQGNRVEALRQYGLLAERLQRSLGLEPSLELLELVRTTGRA